MLITSFATTAIAIGVAVWLFRQNRRLHERGAALAQLNDTLDRKAKTLREAVGRMADEIRTLEIELKLSRSCYELPQQSTREN